MYGLKICDLEYSCEFYVRRKERLLRTRKYSTVYEKGGEGIQINGLIMIGIPWGLAIESPIELEQEFSTTERRHLLAGTVAVLAKC
jgi:hypothetical protein